MKNIREAAAIFRGRRGHGNLSEVAPSFRILMNSRGLREILEGVTHSTWRPDAQLLPHATREIDGAGFRQADTGADFQHAHYEWFYLLHGQSQMKIGDKTYRVQAGDSCFLSPGTWHCDVYNASTRPYESLWFGLGTSGVTAIHFAYHPVGRWEVVGYGTLALPPELPPLLTAMRRELESEPPFSGAMRRSLMMQIAVMLARVAQAEAAPFSVSGEVTRRAREYLEAHYRDEVSLQSVAQAVYLSPNYLASLFKKESGETIIEALTAVRLRHAKRLLREGKSIGQVADEIGYASPAYFSRVFQKHVGTAPKNYRR